LNYDLETIKSELPKRIRDTRKLHKLSMSKFGEVIGATSSNVSDWENGKYLPSLSAIIAISQKFNVSLDWLLTGQKVSAFDFDPPSLRKMMESVDLNDPNERAMHDIYFDFLAEKEITKLNDAVRLMNQQERNELLWYASWILNRNINNVAHEQLDQAIYKKKQEYQRIGEPSQVKETESQYIPVVGRAAAGVPITAIPFVEGYMPVDKQYKDCFAVRVKGDSMVEAGIPDGGYVVVRRQPQVENGEIALVMIDDEVTIKKFVLENGRGSLIAANHKYKPIFVDSRNDVQILGKVVKVFTNEEIKDEIKEDLSFLSQQ